MKKIINNLFIAGFIFYVLFVVWQILFKYSTPLQLFGNREYFRSVNIIPFNDIINGNFNKLDIVGNVILFIPLGIYLNIINPTSKISNNIYIIIGTSLGFECIQYILGLGATDTTDIITNSVGGLIGIGIYKVIEKLFKNKVKVKNFVTICSTVVMVFVGILITGIVMYN
ncbi:MULTISPECIES: VanZ family protein [Paraclostridium]|uniref:VanZ family protein n=1 Tax=Paraclostridium TaxID=1849822 RepID=UPI0021C32103|nr:VanZ family protein [Paraclostridium bifermentans]GKZ02844.1 membrane protein, VanZ family [Paraclostridium bifermentans]GKZ06575.1 membrane protein, VanZ family [Paraclostridium bifermentans]GKZ10228.1 membrane protein, VanZ family [Paraclostridium bifermentans]